MKFAAARTSALLCLLFVVVYNACNALSALRTDVQVWAFSWEQYIPYIDWFLVPYWSIDIFFVFAPFLCRNEIQLKTFRNRVATAILVGGACFLIMPLTLAFQRPEPHGPFAPLMAALYSFDKPHNLFPSLHIALRTLLVGVYVSRTSGVFRFTTHAWFSLVGFSTLLTWQHQVIDVVGGFFLAAMCVQLFPSAGHSQAGAVNRRVALFYGIAALVLLVAARLNWPWTVILAWPGFACVALSLSYLGIGCPVWGKREGRLSWFTRIFMAPIRLGHELSRRHYRRQSRPWDALDDRVLIGSLPSEAEAKALVDDGVRAVVDLTSEFQAPAAFGAIQYRGVPLPDLTAPSLEQMREAAEFISAARLKGKVYVHCKAGYSRTAAMAGAWLLLERRVHTADEACEFLKSARSGMIIRPEVRLALSRFESALRES